VAITHRVRDGRQDDYEQWMNENGPLCRSSPGGSRSRVPTGTDHRKAAVCDRQKWVDSGSRFRRSRGQSESLLAWLPVVTDHTGSNGRVASATHICDGAPAIAVQSAVAIAFQRSSLTIAILHRPSLKDAHSHPMSRSSCAVSSGQHLCTQPPRLRRR